MIKKFLESLFAACCLLFFAFGIFLETNQAKQYVRNELIALVEQKTGYRVEIKDIILYPSFQATLKGISLYEKEKPQLSIAELQAGINPFEWIWKTLHLYSIRAEEIFFYGDVKNEEKLNLQYLLGNFKISDEGAEIKGNFQFALQQAKEIPISIDLELKNKQGMLTLYASEKKQAKAFLALESNTLEIKQLEGSYDSFAFNGQAALTLEGIFKTSTFSFILEEFSEENPFKGLIRGEGKITGPIWSPELKILAVSDAIEIDNYQLTSFRTKISSRHSKMGLNGDVSVAFQKDEVPYEFSGNLYWDRAKKPLPSRFTAKTNLAEIAQILNIDTTDISGDIELTLTLQGKEVHMQALLKNGALESYELGSLMTDVEATLEGNLQRLNLMRFHAKDGDLGTYTADGFLELDQKNHFPYEISMALQKVHLVQLDDFSAVTSGELTLKGDIRQAELKGMLRADSVVLNLPDQTASVKESIDVIYINQAPDVPLPTPYKIHRREVPLNLNIDLNIPQTFVINGTSLSSQWKGTGVITGSVHAPKVNGELSIVKGKYKLRGRQLDVRQGTISFAGDLDKKISIYVIGETKIDRYTIELIVKGPTHNPLISFRSNPPLSQKEILSWLLFNKDITNISEFQGNRLNQSVMTLSTNTDDGPDLLTQIGDAVGIDRIDISGNSEAGQVSFELGKYISDNTYISISRKPVMVGESHRFGTGTQEQDEQDQSNRIGIETNIGQNIKLQAEVDEDQAGQINLIWKKDY